MNEFGKLIRCGANLNTAVPDHRVHAFARASRCNLVKFHNCMTVLFTLYPEH